MRGSGSWVHPAPKAPVCVTGVRVRFSLASIGAAELRTSHDLMVSLDSKICDTECPVFHRMVPAGRLAFAGSRRELQEASADLAICLACLGCDRPRRVCSTRKW